MISRHVMYHRPNNVHRGFLATLLSCDSEMVSQIQLLDVSKVLSWQYANPHLQLIARVTYQLINPSDRTGINNHQHAALYFFSHSFLMLDFRSSWQDGLDSLSELWPGGTKNAHVQPVGVNQHDCGSKSPPGDVPQWGNFPSPRVVSKAWPWDRAHQQLDHFRVLWLASPSGCTAFGYDSVRPETSWKGDGDPVRNHHL